MKLTQEFLEQQKQILMKEWHPTKNKDLSVQDMLTKNRDQKHWWLGSCGHEWKAMIGNRVRGAKCPYCAQKRKIENKNCVSKKRKPRKSIVSETNNLTISHPTLIQYWHPIKNGDLTPKQVLKSSRQKVWWQCSKGHEWELSIHGAVRRLELNGVECLHCHHEKKKKQTNPNIR